MATPPGNCIRQRYPSSNDSHSQSLGATGTRQSAVKMSTEAAPPEITRQNVEAALKADKGPEADLQSFEVHNFTKRGDNYVTLVDGVEVKFSLGGVEQRTSYVVKYRPRRVKEFEDFAYALYQKEQAVYQQMFPEVQLQLKDVGQQPLGVPRCLHTSMEGGKEVIFLEDLRPRGFRMFDRTKGLDLAHSKLVLEELAKLHAASRLMMSQTKDLVEKCPLLDVDWFNYADDAEEKTQATFFSSMEKSAAVLKDISGYEEVSEWLSRNKHNAAKLLEKELKRSPTFDVLCHGDCWTNNLLFRYNAEGVPVEIALVDFQISRQASLATDLTFFLQVSLEGDLRKANLESLLDSYFSAFKRVTDAGKAAMPFTRRQLREEYRQRLHYSLIIATFVNLIILSGGEVDTDDLTGSVEGVLAKLKSTAMFRTRFLSIFDDVIESNILK